MSQKDQRAEPEKKVESSLQPPTKCVQLPQVRHEVVTPKPESPEEPVEKQAKSTVRFGLTTQAGINSLFNRQNRASTTKYVGNPRKRTHPDSDAKTEEKEPVAKSQPIPSTAASAPVGTTV